jgi:hypothetical protein
MTIAGPQRHVSLTVPQAPMLGISRRSAKTTARLAFSKPLASVMCQSPERHTVRQISQDYGWLFERMMMMAGSQMSQLLIRWARGYLRTPNQLELSDSAEFKNCSAASR